ncbi:transposase [Streptomyces caatingaensis]
MNCPACGSSDMRQLNNGNWQCGSCGAVTAGSGGMGCARP